MELLIANYILNIILPVWLIKASSEDSQDLVYPLKQVSKLECRFQEYKDLWKECIQDLPILKTKDYIKYIKEKEWYNEFTRFYSVLWGASYKYWWDIWYWGHQWIDIVSSKWTPVIAIAKWKVIVSENNWAWWNVISIEHEIRWKKVFSNYAHLSSLIVNVWDEVKVWDIIWEVWSTWNSTWNHLHFQIDLNTASHPYYYDYKACPFSYNDISEKWVCFEELEKNTLDPLLLIETNWKILDQVDYESNKISRIELNQETIDNLSKLKWLDIVENVKENHSNISIFDKTVYIWYYIWDIRELQSILKELSYYKWEIDGKYENIEKIIIDYQIENKIIENKDSYWAWWFWPLTRQKLRLEYDKFKSNWKKSINKQENNTIKTETIINKETTKINIDNKQKEVNINKTDKTEISINKNIIEINKTKIKTQKIERSNLKTREDIEKQEIEDFLSQNSISTSLTNISWNIKKWWSIDLNISISRKYKDKKEFIWNTPWDISFKLSNDFVDIFPKKIFYFENWERNISLKWVKIGKTKLEIYLANKLIKTYNLNIYDWSKEIYPESSSIILNKKVTLWETNNWIIVFKDSKNKNLIDIEYWSSFKIKWNSNTKICLKKWTNKNIKEAFLEKCNKEDFLEEVNFSYKDSSRGLLMFDYIVEWKWWKIEILNNYKNISLGQKNIESQNPKWLDKSYVYSEDIVSLLWKWLKNSVKKWNFMQEQLLSNIDTYDWIKYLLKDIEKNTKNTKLKLSAKEKLRELEKEDRTKTKQLSRWEFLDITYKYFILNTNKINTSKLKIYKDLNENLNKKAAIAFWEKITWKDQFWDKYFQVNKNISRWEAAFFLNKTLEKSEEIILSYK